jgi:hypothetical protein
MLQLWFDCWSRNRDLWATTTLTLQPLEKMIAIQKVFGKRQTVSIEVKDLKVSAGVGGTRKGKRANLPFSRAQ